MTRILHINSSIFSDAGVSSQLTSEFVQALTRANPQTDVVYRDLAANPLSHLDGTRLSAIFTDAAERSEEQAAIAAEADTLIAELQAADLLVLGAPMYNFSIPSQLKAWFDYVARAGVTFRYTESGPKGLLEGKRAVVFTSRGGLHRDSDRDTLAPMVRNFLGLLGIRDVEFVYAEGLNLGDAARQQGLELAKAEIAGHIERLQQAA